MIAVMVCLMVFTGVAQAQVTSDKTHRLIVHEWGVLTTIALPDGKAVNWSPLEVLNVQPEFVQQFPMTQTTALVRFELPAVFFRVDEPLDVQMSMEWLDGYFASCYPRADLGDHSLSWQQATIMPGSAFPLPKDVSASHYYQARQTNASFVRVDYFGHKQYERFMTLRALGTLDLPVAVAVNQEEFTFTQAGQHPVSQAIVIENIDGKLGYETIALKPGSETIVPRLKRTDNVDLSQARLRKLLNQQGLYPDEAAAAVAGVRQDWFGPGVRVIYFLPRPMIDGPMQMTVTPAPSEHLRLYAVRVELITPALIQQVKQQLVGLDANDTAANSTFMLSSPLMRPLLTKLLADMEDDAEHLHICDKINLLLKQPLAKK